MRLNMVALEEQQNMRYRSGGTRSSNASAFATILRKAPLAAHGIMWHRGVFRPFVFDQSTHEFIRKSADFVQTICLMPFGLTEDTDQHPNPNPVPHAIRLDAA